MWENCLMLAAVLVAVGLIKGLYEYQKGRSFTLWMAVFVFLAGVVFWFPINAQSEPAGIALLASVIHAIALFLAGILPGDFLEGLPPEMPEGLYMACKYFGCGLLIGAPVLTFSMILRYFSSYFERLRLWSRGGRDIYVFSELNERSLSAASNIQRSAELENRRIAIVFCRPLEEDSHGELEESARGLQAIFMSKQMEQLRLKSGRRKVYYFEIGEDEDDNVDNTMYLIDSLTARISREQQKNNTIYCYSTGAAAEILIDAKDAQSLRVILVDEVRDAVYHQIFQHPLYTNLNPLNGNGSRGKIVLLLVGGGKTGTEFLKAALWCGQMLNFDLEIHMLDIKGNMIRKNLQMQCPELRLDDPEQSDYRIFIHKGNIFSSRVQETLRGIRDVNYCVVALGDDDENIRAGIFLRRYFYMEKTKNTPYICVQIKSEKNIRLSGKCMRIPVNVQNYIMDLCHLVIPAISLIIRRIRSSLQNCWDRGFIFSIRWT